MSIPKKMFRKKGDKKSIKKTLAKLHGAAIREGASEALSQAAQNMVTHRISKPLATTPNAFIAGAMAGAAGTKRKKKTVGAKASTPLTQRHNKPK